MSRKLKFINAKRSNFFAATRQRVDDHFTQNAISKHANAAMFFKTIFFLSGLLLFYCLIISNLFGVWTMLIFAGLVGAFSAFIGINICHDAIHGAFSPRKNVNLLLSLVFNILGASSYVWNITHNMVHHSYTNVAGYDEDIDIAPGLIRISTTEKVNKFQRYQHFYAFFLYGFASLSWVFRKDYLKFFKNKIGQHPNTNHPKKEYFNLFFFKSINYSLFIGLPLVILDITFLQFLAGFLVMHLVQGLVLGVIFQLAHVVEGVAFPFPDDQGNIEEEWAVHQLRTTANFASKSRLVSFFCGGLNFQIEHHLFPKICHIHYPVITTIVKNTAEEFNLPHLEYPTFLSALKSHYRMLQHLGRDAYLRQRNETNLHSTFQ
ncbi:MAG: acyl-CoA desaturase [Chitinophagaceae bacterium]